jgi:hypothetical protein
MIWIQTVKIAKISSTIVTIFLKDGSDPYTLYIFCIYFIYNVYKLYENVYKSEEKCECSKSFVRYLLYILV